MFGCSCTGLWVSWYRYVPVDGSLTSCTDFTHLIIYFCALGCGGSVLSLISFSRIFCAWQLNPPNCDCSGLHGEWEKDTMWCQSIIWWLMLGGHLANSPLQEVPLHSLLLVTFCVYRKMHRCHFTPIICMTLFINMPKHWIKLWQGVRMEQDEMSFATY